MGKSLDSQPVKFVSARRSLMRTVALLKSVKVMLKGAARIMMAAVLETAVPLSVW